MKNDLLELLRSHIEKNGYAKERDFEGITCVPTCMKNVMLGAETEDDLAMFDLWLIDTVSLERNCEQCFFAKRHYEKAEEYAAAAAWEYATMAKKNLFPDELMKGGFFTFFHHVMFEMSEQSLERAHRYYDDTGIADSFDTRYFESMPYLIRYPRSYEEGKKYPVIVLFHGSGSRGTNIEDLKKNSYFALTEKRSDHPFVTVAPLCHENTWFDLLDVVKRFLRALPDLHFCDASRIYAMGASMGGYAVWQLAMSLPDYFAAIVPICGGGMYWNAERLISTPIWAFHGEDDDVVLSEETKRMVERINLFGGRARMTIYPHCGHDAWLNVYGNDEVYRWLLSKKRF